MIRKQQHSKPAERHFNATMTWHVLSEESGGGCSLGEVELRPGCEPPLHVHTQEDETWFVLQGRILFQRGTDRVPCGSGQSIFLPRGVPHGFAVLSEHARILHFYAPGGIEAAFRATSAEAPPDAEMAERIEKQFAFRGVTFVGPPLPAVLAAENEASLGERR